MHLFAIKLPEYSLWAFDNVPQFRYISLESNIRKITSVDSVTILR